MKDLNCGIHINAPYEHEEFVNEVSCFISQKIDQKSKRRRGRYIYTANTQMYINKSSDYWFGTPEQQQNDFLYFKHYIEITPTGEQTLEEQAEFVSKLLEYFWSKGYKAVAVTDYEDMLPHKGGYDPKEEVEIG